MILATHALVGAAIGKTIHSPLLVIAVSLPIHFILDAFHHGEYLNKKSTISNTAWKVALDLLSGLTIIMAYIFYTHPDQTTIRNILLGSFSSMFPDLLTVLYWQGNWKFLKKIYTFHGWVHRLNPLYGENDWTLRNSTNDIIFSLSAILLLLF
jgi:hypothetical protein